MSWLHGLSGGFGEAFAELAWPTRCLGCNLPGTLLCDECRQSLPWIDQRWACPVCGAPHGWLTCTECGRSRGGDGMAPSASLGPSETGGRPVAWPTRTTVCSFVFEGAPASMARAFKDGHELRLAPVIAAAMHTALDEAAGWDAGDGRPRFDLHGLDALCFVPATAEAYARRGFDHMELVSKALSESTGIPLADVLVRVGAKDQRSLGREERQRNLRGTVDVDRDVAGLNLLLADDVVTTGASMRACAQALVDHGAASVTACAFARVLA